MRASVRLRLPESACDHRCKRLRGAGARELLGLGVSFVLAPADGRGAGAPHRVGERRRRRLHAPARRARSCPRARRRPRCPRARRGARGRARRGGRPGAPRGRRRDRRRAAPHRRAAGNPRRSPRRPAHTRRSPGRLADRSRRAPRVSHRYGGGRRTARPQRAAPPRRGARAGGRARSAGRRREAREGRGGCLQRVVDLLASVGQRGEPGLELRGRRVDAAREQLAAPAAVGVGIARESRRRSRAPGRR